MIFDEGYGGYLTKVIEPECRAMGANVSDSVWIFAGSVAAALIVLFAGWLQQNIARASTVSGYRQKWIQDVRAAFLAYLEELDVLADKVVGLKEESRQVNSSQQMLEWVREVRHRKHAFTLYLNPREEEHRQFVKRIDETENCLIHTAPEDLMLNLYEARRNALLGELQSLLKEEWDRVKLGELRWRFRHWRKRL